MSEILTTPEDIDIRKIVSELDNVRALGTSSLGNIYEATHPQYGKCALKLMIGQATKNKKLLDRFFTPLQNLKSTTHSTIAAIYEIRQSEYYWILREYAPGISLQEKIQNYGRLSLKEANHILLQLVSGLASLHDIGLVHKNLKPSNIIVDDANNIKIVDFSLPPTTPHYLSPEQCKGKRSNVSSDIYAVGVIYYFCLCGKPPFAGETSKEVMDLHVTAPCPDIRDIRNDLPPGVNVLLRKMLAKDPMERISDCRQLHSKLLDIEEFTKEENFDDAIKIMPQKPPQQPLPSRKPEEKRNFHEQTIQLIEMTPPQVTERQINKFKQLANEMAGKLRIFNQTLAMLENANDNEDLLFLDEMLRFITRKTGDLLGADRTIIFLLDEERSEYLAIMDEDDGKSPLEMRISATSGILGQISQNKEVLIVPYDFYDYPHSASRREIDEKTNYRTYTMMALPVLDTQGKIIAIIQLINKLQPVNDPADPLIDRIDMKGFTDVEQQLFSEFAPSIRLILESSRSFYRATRRQRAVASLMSATQSLIQGSLDLEETLDRVMNEAKQLLDADRITLWLLDNEKDELWAKIQTADGENIKISIPKYAGFAGQVVKTQEPLLIPFDLYDHPNSDTAKKTDQETKYRTCSMLCMPVFNADQELIGVTQLINKKRQGNFASYNPDDWPEVPDCWKASFNRADQEFMKSFNIQAGVALQNAKLFDMIQRQEKMQRDILRSLSNGVISTDKSGNVLAANDSAKKLLGLQENLRGKNICELIHIVDGAFPEWLKAALSLEKDEQYYPEQVLLSHNSSELNINLSINPITDLVDQKKSSGALVVIEDISHEKRMKNMMYRYMTQEVVETLLSSDKIQLGGERKEVSVLFSDIRSYTTLTEGMKAEEVVAMLNEYFEEMVDAIFKHQGTLDKYIGDAIMAVFGSPLDLQDHGWWAVKTAIEMRYRLLQFNIKRKMKGQPPIKIGIGIHTDEVICGNIGSSKRMELTSIGDGVNLASRLEGASKQYGCDIVISEKTYDSCNDRIYARELDVIIPKGKTEPVKIFEVLGLKEVPIDPEKLLMMKHYHLGREFYTNTRFSEAIEEFKEVLKISPYNLATHLHIERCQHFLESPPPKDWDGVWKLTSK